MTAEKTNDNKKDNDKKILEEYLIANNDTSTDKKKVKNYS